MNTNHSKYTLYNEISNNWPLDDWSIPKECFDKIVEILPFDSTILELGSGKSTDILSKFYNMISIEESTEWINKYNSNYIHVPINPPTRWYNVDILSKKLHNLNYDMIIVDGPKGFRNGLCDNIELFKTNLPIIFDDTMSNEHFNLYMNIVKKLNKTKYETIQCKVNKYAVTWMNGKKFSIIY